MEHQPNDKVVMVCGDCAPKPGSFTGMDPNSFVGKMVKLAFKATKPDGKETKEHMWVHATHAVAGEWMRGILLNTPYFKTSFQRGDAVGFKVSDIEQAGDMSPKAQDN